MRSIRSFLLSRLLGGAAVVMFAAGAVVFVVVTRYLEAQFDAGLSQRVRGFASILFQVKDEVEFEFADELMPEYEAGERAEYFQLWFEDGRLLERSNSLRGGSLEVAGTPAETDTHWTARLPDDREGRFVSRVIEVHHVYPEEGPSRPAAARVVVVVARGREALVAAERLLFLNCVAVAFLLLALIAIVSWTAVQRGLEPTKRLARALDAIQVDHLPEAFDVGPLPTELSPVADKTNALIGRVDTALKRERRTTADIAHELRTPISEVLTVSEVALRSGQDVEGTQRALATVREVAWRMGRSVSTLLKLARLEMGAETFDCADVELGRIVDETLSSFAALERERELRVENRLEAGEHVDGDREVLRIIVSNLLSNALYYVPRRGLVECRLERANGHWRFVVENDAPDLSRQDLDVMFEPFWRKDRARADRNRSGLGLALSRALAEKAGMGIVFELDENRFRAVVERTGGNGSANGGPPTNGITA